MVNRILYYSGALLLLILTEGIMTLGYAFKFEEYNIFAWVIQSIVLIFTFASAEKVLQYETRPKKSNQ
jgi:hypothetical protein